MKRSIQRVFPQPMLAIVLGTIAVSSLIIALRGYSMEAMLWPDWPMLALALGLVVAGVVADQRPVHVTYHTKVALTTVPLFLIAVLLPLPLVALAAGGSSLVGEMLERKRRGSLPADIASATARAVIVGMFGAVVSRVAFPFDETRLIALFAAAGVMFAAEILVGSLEIAAVMGEPPRRVISMLVREISLVEAVQFVLGILGAVAALVHVSLVLLLLAPVFFVYRAFRSARELQTGTRQLLESLADTVDLRDPYTGGHSRRVTALCGEILRELRLEGPDAELILTAARVHDIGKIGIPDGVLNKPGALDPEERAIMETHSVRGAELLQRYPDFVRGMAIVRHHHERWDGKGYPDGKAGYDIPFGARVIAVADSFDAMTSDRPYRKGMSKERACMILREGRGTQWDEQIVDAFLRAIAHILLEQSSPRTTSAQSALNQASVM